MISWALYKPIPRFTPFVETFGLDNVAYGIPFSKKVLEIIKIYSVSRLISAKRREGCFVSSVASMALSRKIPIILHNYKVSIGIELISSTTTILT